MDRFGLGREDECLWLQRNREAKWIVGWRLSSWVIVQQKGQMNWWKLEREARRACRYTLPLFTPLCACVRAWVLLLSVQGKKLWWSRATIFMPLIMFYIPFKCPGIQLCHTAAVSRCLAVTEIHFVWHRQAVAGGKVNRGHFKWPVLWLATLKGWGWPVATQLAHWLRF